MQSTIQSGDKILIVGDGDFSFTVALVRHFDVAPHQVFTSNLETEATILHHAQASDNMNMLKGLGVSVFLETDATDLHNHPVISKERFDRIIFNFPLADRHNIKKNRSLLADFFSSCRSVLASKGCVMMTLCKGQGGTPADNPIRSWHDSWQVVAMATNASFLLRVVLPFDPADFPEYHSVGFRFQDKSFNVTGALTHMFEDGNLVEDGDLNLRGVVHKDGKSYSCSSYVASHLNRNLLEEPVNPVSILRQTVEERLKTDLSVNDAAITEICNPIIPFHKSTVYRCAEEAEATDSTSVSVSPPNKPSDKSWKNSENLKIMAKTQLAHGVLPVNTNTGGVSRVESRAISCLPRDRDNVYILVKSKDSEKNGKAGNGEEDMDFDNGQIGEDTMGDTSGCLGGGGCGDGGGGSTSSVEKTSIGSSGEESCFQELSPLDTDNATDSSSRVYHCRTSLLENLPYLCPVFGKTKMMGDNDSNNCDRILMEGGDDKDTGSPSTLPMVNQSELDAQVSLTKIPCLVTSGQTMQPCHITPSSSPIKHEMLILHQISDDNDLSSSREECSASNTLRQSCFDSISSKIMSLLHTLSDSTSFSFIKESQDTPSLRVKIDGIEETHLIGQVNLTRSSSEEDTIQDHSSSQCSDYVGLIFLAKMGRCSYHVTVLDLQQIVCRLCRIDDWRLLWSDSDKFVNQFRSGPSIFSLCQFRPFSLYPMKFVHDLSFWEPTQEADDNAPATFDELALCDTIRCVAGDLVTNVSLIDVYEDTESKRKSRCYRLHFLSSDKCLPYVTSWKMQSKIRMEVARSLGVQLR